MDFLSVYLVLQGIIIVLALIFICYVVKEFLIPIINGKIEKEAKETVYEEPKDKTKEPMQITETDTEVIYYYGNGDEYHSPIGGDNCEW